jgi:flagellar motor switch protein FliM
MNIQQHQFGKPAKLAEDLDARLVTWFKAATALAPGFWDKVLPMQVTLQLTGSTLATPAAALASLPSPCVACRVMMESDSTSLIAFPRPLVLALVAGLLGDSTTDPITDRELTSVEEDLCSYFLQDVFLAPLREAWPGLGGMELDFDQWEPYPQWTKIFTGVELLIVCKMLIRGPFGEEKVHWLVPQKAIASLSFEEELKEAKAQAKDAKHPCPQLEDVVRELPVEITVQLGKADIALDQLANLRVGDLLILNQPISEPLTALVEGEKNLYAWAGRVGSWKAVQLDAEP